MRPVITQHNMPSLFRPKANACASVIEQAMCYHTMVLTSPLNNPFFPFIGNISVSDTVDASI